MKKKDGGSELDPRDVMRSLDGGGSANVKPSDGEALSGESGCGDKPSSPTLAEVIREQATEDERPLSKSFTLRKILGGEILDTSTIRQQIWVFVIVTVFIVLYISNRYSCQQYLIEIDALNVELKDVKYKALSSSSMLTEMSRESRVLEKLKTNKDSVLHISKQPPFIINVP